MKIRYLLFLIILVISCNNPEKQIPTETKDSAMEFIQLTKSENPTKSAQIDRYFKDLVRFHNFNGAILVSQKGNIIYENYRGYCNIPQRDTLTQNSSFQLASVSKQFSAVSVMMLHEKGLINYEDTIQKFIPRFPYKNITIRQLLTHYSGLPKYMYFCEKYTDKSTPITNQDVINIMIEHRPQEYYRPGQRFFYCNTNYVILAYIVEKVSKMPFAEFLAKNIFEPLNMKHTFVKTPNTNTDSLYSTTMGHYFNGRNVLPFYQDYVLGDKSVYSSVEDMYLWDKALYTEKLLKQSTIAEAFKPVRNFKKPASDYGFGWRLRLLDKCDTLIFHGGWYRGYNTLIIRIPKDTSSIVILSNKRTDSFLINYQQLLCILDTSLQLCKTKIAKAVPSRNKNSLKAKQDSDKPSIVEEQKNTTSYYTIIGTRLSQQNAQKLKTDLKASLGLLSRTKRRASGSYLVYTNCYQDKGEAMTEVQRLMALNVSEKSNFACHPYITISIQ